MKKDIYFYEDSDGNIVGKKVRGFFSTKNGLVNSCKEGLPVFYRLPDLMFSENDQDIWITDDEDSCDWLSEKGYVSVCLPFGPKSAPGLIKKDPDAMDRFKSRTVIYIPTRSLENRTEVQKHIIAFRKVLDQTGFIKSLIVVDLYAQELWSANDVLPVSVDLSNYIEKKPDGFSGILDYIKREKSIREDEIQDQLDQLRKEQSYTSQNVARICDEKKVSHIIKNYTLDLIDRRVNLKNIFDSAELAGNIPADRTVKAFTACTIFLDHIIYGTSEDIKIIEYVLETSCDLNVIPPLIDRKKLARTLYDYYHAFVVGPSAYLFDEDKKVYLIQNEHDLNAMYDKIVDLIGNDRNREQNKSYFGQSFIDIGHSVEEIDRRNKGIEDSYNYLTFKNGTFDVNAKSFTDPSYTQFQSAVVSAPLNPAYLSDDELFNQRFNSSRWCRFLKESFDCEETIENFQRMFGLLLIPQRKRVHKVFLMYGDGGNGKSVVSDIANHLFTKKDIVGNVSLAGMENDFIVATLATKRINVSSDSARVEDVVASSLFKMITGGDDNITFNPKGKDVFNADVNLTMLLSINTLPSSWEQTYAMDRRLEIFPFSHSYGSQADLDSGKVDRLEEKDLSTKLINEEMDLIVAWALRGFYKLKENKWQFIESKEMEEVKKEYQLENNNFSEFIESYAEIDSSLKLDQVGSAKDKNPHYMPFNIVYWMYLDYLKIEHPGQKAMSQKDIKKYIQKNLSLDMGRCNRVNHYLQRDTSTNSNFVAGISLDAWIQEMQGRGFTEPMLTRELHKKPGLDFIYRKNF